MELGCDSVPQFLLGIHEVSRSILTSPPPQKKNGHVVRLQRTSDKRWLEVGRPEMAVLLEMDLHVHVQVVPMSTLCSSDPHVGFHMGPGVGGLIPQIYVVMEPCVSIVERNYFCRFICKEL